MDTMIEDALYTVTAPVREPGFEPPVDNPRAVVRARALLLRFLNELPADLTVHELVDGLAAQPRDSA